MPPRWPFRPEALNVLRSEGLRRAVEPEGPIGPASFGSRPGIPIHADNLRGRRHFRCPCGAGDPCAAAQVEQSRDLVGLRRRGPRTISRTSKEMEGREERGKGGTLPRPIERRALAKAVAALDIEGGKRLHAAANLLKAQGSPVAFVQSIQPLEKQVHGNHLYYSVSKKTVPSTLSLLKGA